MPLEPADALEVLILVDNVSDMLLLSSAIARRPPPTLDPLPRLCSAVPRDQPASATRCS